MLWDKRNAVIAEKDRVIEAQFDAARRGDTPAYELHKTKAEALLLDEEALSAEMRPLQFKAWERVDNNVVTNVGRNDILDKYWRGSAYTQTVVMGLAGTGTKAAADTQASHAGWLEVGGTNAPVYTGNRKAVTMGAASSQSQREPAADLRHHQHRHRERHVHEQRRQRDEGRHHGRVGERGQLHGRRRGGEQPRLAVGDLHVQRVIP